jgi:hypothetical protein
MLKKRKFSGQRVTKDEASGVFGPDEAIAEAIRRLFSKKSIKQTTELTEDEVNQVAVGFGIANAIRRMTTIEVPVKNDKGEIVRYEIIEGTTFFEEIYKEWLMLRVSKDRKGRKEITNMVNFMNMPMGGMMGVGGGGGTPGSRLRRFLTGRK